MKKLLLLAVLGLTFIAPSAAFADLAPDPDWLPNDTTTSDTTTTNDANQTQDAPVPTLYEEPTATDEGIADTELYEELRASPSDDRNEAWAAFAMALYVTIIVETVAAAIIIALLRRPMHAVVGVPIASLVTLPLFWGATFAAVRGGTVNHTNWLLFLVLAEIVVVLIEAIILYVLHRTSLSKNQALLVSLVMNAASVLVGYMLGISG